MDTYLVVIETSNNEVKSEISHLVTTFPDSIKIMDNAWGVVSNKSIQEIREILLQPLSDKDKLLVVMTGYYSSRYNFNPKITQWLKTFM